MTPASRRGRQRGRRGSVVRTTAPAEASRSDLAPWATIRPFPITTRSSAITSISWSRCEESSTVPPRSANSRSRPTHPPDAGRVEPVGRLVEDQHRRVADQRRRQAEPLPHAERVVADAPRRLLRGQADEVEHLVDPDLRQSHEPLGDGEDLPAGAPGVLGGRVEQHADLQARVGQVDVAAAGDGRAARRGVGEPDDDAHGRGLPGAVGPQESGDPAGVRGEADVVDGDELAVPPGDRVEGDHGVAPACV